MTAPQPDTKRDLELIERALGYAPSGLADRVRQIARTLAARLAETEARAATLEAALRRWQEVSPLHRYECNPLGKSGCSCGLEQARTQTRAALDSAAPQPARPDETEEL